MLYIPSIILIALLGMTSCLTKAITEYVHDRETFHIADTASITPNSQDYAEFIDSWGDEGAKAWAELEAAIEGDDVATVRMLVPGRDIGLNSTNSNGQTALDLAKKYQKPAIEDYLYSVRNQ